MKPIEELTDEEKIKKLEEENEKLKYNHMINEDAFFTNKQQAEKIKKLEGQVLELTEKLEQEKQSKR